MIGAGVAIAWLLFDRWKYRARISYRRQLASMAANFPGALFRRRIWPDGRIEYDFISEGAASLFGASPEQWRGAQSLAELAQRVLPEDRPAWLSAMENSIREVSPMDMEVRVMLPEGGFRWIRTVAKGWRQGGAAVFDGVAFDVTAQKLAEEKLRDAERRLAAIVDSSRDAIWSWNSDGTITSWNAEAERLFGYSAAEAVGRSILLLVPPESQTAAYDALARLREGGWFGQYETVRVTKDGRRVAVELTVSPIHDPAGRTVGASTICRDITRRREAEAALQHSEELLRLSQEAGRVGSFEWDIQRSTSRHSREYERLYGVPAGELAGSREGWLAGIHPDDKAAVLNQRRAALDDRLEEHQIEFRIVRPDGSIRWVEARSRAFYDAKGEPQRLVGVNVDITDRKESEQRQSLLLHELNHRVKNVLANIHALWSQTRRSSAPNELSDAFEGRLKSFARTHQALLESGFEAASMQSLADQELEPYLNLGADLGLVDIEGPELSLKAHAAQMIALALHELATNSAKYGALGAQRGRVSLRWSIAANGGHRVVRILWREAGARDAASPSRSGFGRTLLERIVPGALEGAATLEFLPTGALYELEFPAAANAADAARTAPDAIERIAADG